VYVFQRYLGGIIYVQCVVGYGSKLKKNMKKSENFKVGRRSQGKVRSQKEGDSEHTRDLSLRRRNNSSTGSNEEERVGGSIRRFRRFDCEMLHLWSLQCSR
jgi:hypothetical protein